MLDLHVVHTMRNNIILHFYGSHNPPVCYTIQAHWGSQQKSVEKKKKKLNDFFFFCSIIKDVTQDSFYPTGTRAVLFVRFLST